jgi:hypothetical protein
LSGPVRQGLGALLVAAAMVPLVGSLDLLAGRHVITAAVGLAAGGFLTAAGMRLLTGGGREGHAGAEDGEPRAR